MFDRDATSLTSSAVRLRAELRPTIPGTSSSPGSSGAVSGTGSFRIFAGCLNVLNISSRWVPPVDSRSRGVALLRSSWPVSESKTTIGMAGQST